jgi:hypothetical protein
VLLSSTLEAGRSFETSVIVYSWTRHYVQEDMKLNSRSFFLACLLMLNFVWIWSGNMDDEERRTSFAYF